MNKRRAPYKNIIVKNICLFLLSGFWFLSTYNSSVSEFSLYDSLLVFSLVTVILCAQIAFVFVLHFLGAANIFINLSLAFFAVANIYSLHLVLMDYFSAAALLKQSAILALAGIIAFMFFTLLAEHWWRKFSLAVTIVLFGAVSLEAVVYQWQTHKLLNFEQTTLGIGDITSAPNIKTVEFIRKPNVYFISFDGLSTQSVLKKYIWGVVTDYPEVLTKIGFRVFKNHFSNGPTTGYSLNKFLALDPNYYRSLEDPGWTNGLFPGLLPSPLFEIFKANGYTTYVNNFDNYLGAQKGPYIDHYFVPRLFSVCTFLKALKFAHGFFAYCPSLLSAYNNNVFGMKSIANLRFPGLFNDYDLQAVLDMYTHSWANGKPSVFLSYIFLPGHTQPPFHYGYPQTYVRYFHDFSARSKKMAKVIEKIMLFIKKNDPNAIVYVFGDHGAWFSRGLKWDSATPSEKEFIIQERYGVLGALYPPELCQEYFFNYHSTYITPATVAQQIVRCLAGGEDPFINPVKHVLDYNKLGYQGSSDEGLYENYLYE